VIEVLLRWGANINAVQDSHGGTALHPAVSLGRENVVRLLLSRGAITSTQDNWGKIPLHYAIDGNHGVIVGVLLDFGSPILTADQNGWTALHFAVLRGSSALSKHLLVKGADLSARTAEGDTPIQLAQKLGHSTIVQLFSEHVARLARIQKENQPEKAATVSPEDLKRAILDRTYRLKVLYLFSQPLLTPRPRDIHIIARRDVLFEGVASHISSLDTPDLRNRLVVSVDAQAPARGYHLR
jgi:ankyrin repeat protein